jgi:isopenicillin-N epimerase
VNPLRARFFLAPGVTFLNHGSFGAAPSEVLACQQEIQRELEREPVRFLARELPGRLDAVRAAVAPFLGADPDGLAFVPNATTGVNTVLRSLELELEPGDELLTTDHAYNACRNALEFVAARRGAAVRVARIPFPLSAEEEAVLPIVRALTPRTRLLLLDHVTSPTGLVLPAREIIAAAAARGVDVLLDAAHAPGMVDLDIRSLGAAYTTGNFHKWTCAPKGAAFLHVRDDRRERIRPLAISHGATAPPGPRSRFHLEFDWTGTSDPSAVLSVPRALGYLASLLPGGWPEIRQRNRALCLEARDLLAHALGVPPPAPDSMIGALAAMPLPAGSGPPPRSAFDIDPLQDRLLLGHGIEVPVMAWPAPQARLLRVSAHVYNSLEEYERLARALSTELAAGA